MTYLSHLSFIRTSIVVGPALIFAGCDHGTEPDSVFNGPTCQASMNEPQDAAFDPGIPDDYRPYADYAQREHWGPYNVHDPSCATDGGWTWCFSTDASFGNEARASDRFIQVRRSRDLVNWEFVGWACDEIPDRAFSHVSDQNSGLIPEGIWAPFVMRWDGTYRLYYSVSRFGSNGSYLGMATADAPEGPSEDRGAVLTTRRGIDDRNAIDPTVVVDPHTGRHLMAYGSFWDGVYIVELSPDDGKPLVKGDVGHPIARNGLAGNAIEAPEIIHDPERGYYYLFVSYGDLSDEYSIRVGRSDRPEGPYLDRTGRDMADPTNNTPILTSPYRFNGHPGWQGVGHNTVFSKGNGWYSMQQGRLGGGPPYLHLMVMHLRRVFWTDDDWPDPLRPAGGWLFGARQRSPSRQD